VKTRWLSILLLLQAAGAPAPPRESALVIEDRPAEKLIRIVNRSGEDAEIYYNIIPGYGDYQMLRIRFRDGGGRILGGDKAGDGWYTPMMMHSSLRRGGEYPPRDRLKIPAGGKVDLKRDIPALTQMMAVLDSAAAPCALQIMLAGYTGARSNLVIQPVSQWTPVACPEVNARRPGPRPRKR
jgi:hypothetical protein